MGCRRKVCIRQYPNCHHAPPARKAWVSRLYPDSQGYWLPYEGIAMKKQTIFFACIISIVCGMMLGTLGAAPLAQDMFKSQAQLVSVLQTTDSIYEALHTAPRMTDTRLGEALLGRGGYTPELYFWKNAVWLSVLAAGLFLILSAGILVWHMVRQAIRSTGQCPFDLIQIGCRCSTASTRKSIALSKAA